MDLRLVFLIVALNAFQVHSSNSERKLHFCGDKLIDTLSLVCKGHYNGPHPTIKKSMPDFGSYGDSEEDLAWDLNDENQIDFSIYPRDILPPRFRRGIVEECCHSPCSVRHLSLYCVH